MKITCCQIVQSEKLVEFLEYGLLYDISLNCFFFSVLLVKNIE